MKHEKCNVVRQVHFEIKVLVVNSISYDGNRSGNSHLKIRLRLRETPKHLLFYFYIRIPDLGEVMKQSGYMNTQARISICHANSSGNIPWTFDHSQSGRISMNLVLNHEFGHAVGEDHESTKVSIMCPYYSDRYRILWHEDIMQLRNTNNAIHYNHVTTRQILHKRSTDNGSNWYSEGNLQEFTNNKIGVAFNPDSSTYLVAWTGTDGSGHINTILGNGITYHDKRIWNIATDLGPSVAYGNGKYVLTYVSNDDNRHIYYIYSNDGTTWYGPVEVQYKWNSSDTPGTYGSMFEPVITWDSKDSVFILMWINWSSDTSTPIDTLGKIRVCTTPSVYQNFYRCKELPYYSNATPGLSCNSLVDCMFTWTDHTGGDGTNDYKIIYKQAYVNSNNEFIPYGTTAWFTAGGSTRLAPDLATGGNFWLLGWRGNDNNTWGNEMSMGVGSFPNWSDQTFPDSLLQVSPTLKYGDSWSEFTYYYIRR